MGTCSIMSNIHILEQTLNSESLQQFLGEQLLEQYLKFNVKILGQTGFDIAIPSPHDHETTSHVMITRGTNRFVDEVHDHKVELRPSTELLSAPRKSEGKESGVEESNNSNKETCPHVTSRHGNKEACANNLSSPRNRSSLFKKTIIPTNERKWVVIPAHPSYGGALSIQVSKNGYKDGASLRSRRTRI